MAGGRYGVHRPLPPPAISHSCSRWSYPISSKTEERVRELSLSQLKLLVLYWGFCTSTDCNDPEFYRRPVLEYVRSRNLVGLPDLPPPPHRTQVVGDAAVFRVTEQRVRAISTEGLVCLLQDWGVESRFRKNNRELLLRLALCYAKEYFVDQLPGGNPLYSSPGYGLPLLPSQQRFEEAEPARFCQGARAPIHFAVHPLVDVPEQIPFSVKTDVEQEIVAEYIFVPVVVLLLNLFVLALRGKIFPMARWEFLQLVVFLVVTGAIVHSFWKLQMRRNLKKLSLKYYNKNPHLEDASLRSLYTSEKRTRENYSAYQTVLPTSAKKAEDDSIFRSAGSMLLALVFASMKVNIFVMSKWDIFQFALSLFLYGVTVYKVSNLLMRMKLIRIFHRIYTTALRELEGRGYGPEPFVTADELREWSLSGGAEKGSEEEEYACWLWPLAFERLFRHSRVGVWELTLKVPLVTLSWRK